MLSFGAIVERARTGERLDASDVTDDELNAIFDFQNAVARWTVGHAVILRFLSAASARWTGPISILDLGCGRGDLSRGIIEWARFRGLDVRVHGADKQGRAIRLARERNRDVKELTFETRDLKDPFYLLAQSFDYVVSAHALHREIDDQTGLFLKIANRQARRGLVVMDWIRDGRAAFALGLVAGFSRGPAAREQAKLAVRRGFLSSEAEDLRRTSGLDGASTRIHFGYRFSIEGERGMDVAPQIVPNVGLATS